MEEQWAENSVPAPLLASQSLSGHQFIHSEEPAYSQWIMGLNLDKSRKGNYHLNVSRVGGALHPQWFNSTHLSAHEESGTSQALALHRQGQEGSSSHRRTDDGRHSTGCAVMGQYFRSLRSPRRPTGGQLGTLGFAVSLAALLPARLWFTTVLYYSGA